jgi:hypothetical protein
VGAVIPASSVLTEPPDAQPSPAVLVAERVSAARRQKRDECWYTVILVRFTLARAAADAARLATHAVCDSMSLPSRGTAASTFFFAVPRSLS